MTMEPLNEMSLIPKYTRLRQDFGGLSAFGHIHVVTSAGIHQDCNITDNGRRRIKVKVIPRAKKEKIEVFDGILKVYIKAPAIEGRANKRLIELIADYFKVKKYNIIIIKGETSREKVLEIK